MSDSISYVQRFVEQLAQSGKFSRNKISQILFEVSRGDYVHVSGRGALQAILIDLAKSDPNFEVYAVAAELGEPCLWSWLNDSKFKLPRTGAGVRS